MNSDKTPPEVAISDSRLLLISESYHRLTGKVLLEAKPIDPRALWFAPCAIVAHGTEADPIFFYGNRVALQLFEMNFSDFIRLPSRLSAEAQVAEERQKLLEKVTRQNYIDDYSGIRISSSGRRFRIIGATVWNLLDENGKYHGQAATFSPEL
jgi:hypothetical protein